MAKINTVIPLTPDQLCARCDLSALNIGTSHDLATIEGMVGQERAVDAVRFGISIKRQGYNLYVMGPPGSGKHTMVQLHLAQIAKQGTPPSDWCYVYNFAQPQHPQALELPPGQGVQLEQDLDQLVDELHIAIPAAFESDEFQARIESLEQALKSRQEDALNEIHQEASRHNIRLMRTSDGFVFAPTHNGEILGPEDFQKMSPGEREALERLISDLQGKLRKVIEMMPRWSKETRDKIKQVQRDTARLAVSHLVDEIKDKYHDLPEVIAHLDAVQEDIIGNVHEFRKHEDLPHLLLGAAERRQNSFSRYKVNLLIDNSATTGLPVIHEDQPSYQNLIGRVEHISQMGTLVTDFSLIKPGALHRANGGYLILDATKVLTQPYAWEGLKRALRCKQLHIDSLGQLLSLISTVSLEPEPIPLDVKVVLVGDRILYYLLSEYDPEFNELFKVAADFEDDMTRSGDHTQLYARLIATLCQKEALLALDRAAICRVIEHAARLAGDAEKLTTNMRALTDLLSEADHLAREAKRAVIGREDIDSAIAQRKRRHLRLKEQIQDEIVRQTIKIDTDGAKVGQINGLSVLLLGNESFGHPTRITATIRVGEGHIIDIEREVELGGPIHSKGVLILSSYIGARYSKDRPLSMHASLVFEQNYGKIEGDSASLAELCTLLSAIAEVPIAQSLAVTGSVNQHGEVQAIGGVNEKIEGFFEICQARGLTGHHGVIIPADNVKHLMLDQPVIDAVAAGTFNIYPVTQVDEAAALLMGMPAGERTLEGEFPAGSLNALIMERLEQMTEIRHAFAETAKEPDGSSDLGR
ncbi:MAG: AAA family ATPase [Pseudomonadota bacterium]